MTNMINIISLILLTIGLGSVSTAEECRECESVVEYGRLLSDEHMNTTDIKYELRFICKNEPVLTFDTNTIVDHLFNISLSAEDICYLASYDTIWEQQQLSHLSGPTPECEMCEFITAIVRHQALQANATITVIEDIIKAICATQPIIKKDCNFYLDSIQKIINWLVEGLSNKQICENLHMC